VSQTHKQPNNFKQLRWIVLMRKCSKAATKLTFHTTFCHRNSLKSYSACRLRHVPLSTAPARQKKIGEHCKTVFVYPSTINWKRPPGRPRHTWLRTLRADLQPHNLGLNSAWKYAQNREH